MSTSSPLLGDFPLQRLADEVTDELIGNSSKKWGVMLVAFVLGAIVAAVLIRKRRHAKHPAPGPDVIPDPDVNDMISNMK
jgi:hypothetical protein